MAFEAHLDGKADVDRIRFTVNDIRCDAQVGLLVELDDRDHVRNRHGRVERLIVDRVGEHRPATGDGLRSQRSPAVGAVGSGRTTHKAHWVHRVISSCPSAPPVQNARLCSLSLGSIRAGIGGWGVIDHDKESTFQSAVITKIDG